MEQFLSDRKMLGYRLMNLYPDICCFSTTRHDGYSTGRYASFNCNPYCGDTLEAVERNKALLLSLLPDSVRLLAIPHQVHGTEVFQIRDSFLKQTEEERNLSLEGVDALVTNIPGICLCISTADCIPVLLYDPVNKVIAAVHAGWRGTVARLVRKTIETMQTAYGVAPEHLWACIGPGISLKAFEVGDEVYAKFGEAGFPMEQIAAKNPETGKWHLDLWESNRLELFDCGLSPDRIEVAGICTYFSNDDFFSARRLGISSGRMLSGIVIK